MRGTHLATYNVLLVICTPSRIIFLNVSTDKAQDIKLTRLSYVIKPLLLLATIPSLCVHLINRPNAQTENKQPSLDFILELFRPTLTRNMNAVSNYQ